MQKIYISRKRRSSINVHSKNLDNIHWLHLYESVLHEYNLLVLLFKGQLVLSLK